MKAEIISIGTELLLGEITDTNASYLAGELPPLGIELYWISQVGDNQSRLIEVLKRAWQRSDLVLTTGGLGPTDDDITREAIAEMFGETPEIDPSLEKALKERFGRMTLNMPSSNLKQVTIIPSARPIVNAVGTAPGWWVERDGHTIVAMPGPPHEMQLMWQERVKPRLVGSTASIILPRTIKTFGLNEAAVGEMVADLMASANPTLGIYAKPDGIHLRLAAKAGSRELAEKLIAGKEAKIREILEEHIWGVDSETLESAVGRLMVEKGLTLAVMEDYSGGWLAATITDIPESSLFFKGSLVACTDEARQTCNVDPEVIKKHGAVSPEAARAMAEAARDFFKADFGLSTTTTGEAGPRAMGIAYIGIATKNGSRAASRPMRKQHVTYTALFELRKSLISPEADDKNG